MQSMTKYTISKQFVSIMSKNCLNFHCSEEIVVIHLTLWRLAAFGDFRKKTPKCTWLCVGISLVL